MSGAVRWYRGAWVQAQRGVSSTIIGARLTDEELGRLHALTKPTFGFPQNMQPMFPAIHHGGTSVNGVFAPPSGFVMEKATRPTESSRAPAECSVPATVWAVDKVQRLPNIKPMSKIVADSVWQPRLTTVVSTAFAAGTLALSWAGIYRLMIRIVGDRTAEIGIRMAIGATPGSTALPRPTP
jgi:hypothetical protein